MAQYINKSAVVAEIERRRDKNARNKLNLAASFEDNYLLSFLDTIEVKEVKEPTASDRGTAEEIIINLKRVEQDYNIDLTREMEWLRSKEQKRE